MSGSDFPILFQAVNDPRDGDAWHRVWRRVVRRKGKRRTRN